VTISRLPSAKAPRAPRGLKADGKRLWHDVAGTYELRPDELVVLESAARALDAIAALDDARAGAVSAMGSMDQLVVHPLLAERRRQQGLLAQLVRQLRLAEEDSDEAKLAESWKMRRVARARWGGDGPAPAPVD
jgi:hypothetical protein